MNGTFLSRKTSIAMLIAALFLGGCGNDNGNTTAQTATESVAPLQSEQPRQSKQTYQRVKKIYNGQTIYLFDIDDFPLRGVPLPTVKENALNGDPAAQYELGRRLGSGEVVTSDLQEGIKWIQKAARQDYAEAQFELGMMYSLGTGLKQNPKQAISWFSKAAEQNHVLAQDNLSQMYDAGTEVKRDYAKAMYWAQKAADQGFGPSQTRLGVIYHLGLGVQQDKAKALEWYQKAAERNEVEALSGMTVSDFCRTSFPSCSGGRHSRVAFVGNRFTRFSSRRRVKPDFDLDSSCPSDSVGHP